MDLFDDDNKFDEAWHEAILDSFFDEDDENETRLRPTDRKLTKKELKQQRKAQKRRRGFFGF